MGEITPIFDTVYDTARHRDTAQEVNVYAGCGLVLALLGVCF